MQADSFDVGSNPLEIWSDPSQSVVSSSAGVNPLGIRGACSRGSTSDQIHMLDRALICPRCAVVCWRSLSAGRGFGICSSQGRCHSLALTHKIKRVDGRAEPSQRPGSINKYEGTNTVSFILYYRAANGQRLFLATTRTEVVALYKQRWAAETAFGFLMIWKRRAYAHRSGSNAWSGCSSSVSVRRRAPTPTRAAAQRMAIPHTVSSEEDFASPKQNKTPYTIRANVHLGASRLRQALARLCARRSTVGSEGSNTNKAVDQVLYKICETLTHEQSCSFRPNRR